MDDKQRIPAKFFEQDSGAMPVLDWLRAMDKEDKKKIGSDIAAVQKGWPIGLPVCRPLRDHILEVRTDLDNKSSRVLFCIELGTMWLLHSFFKDTQKTPDEAINKAIKRRKIILERIKLGIIC